MHHDYDDDKITDVKPVIRQPHKLNKCLNCGCECEGLYCDIYCKKEYKSNNEAKK